MATRRMLVSAVVAVAALALVAGPAQARSLGLAEAGAVAQAAVAERTDELICVRAVGRAGRESQRRVLCLVGHAPEGDQVCRTLVDVRSGRGAAAPVRARVVRLKLCGPTRPLSSQPPLDASAPPR
jgi:hypothetical protein